MSTVFVVNSGPQSNKIYLYNPLAIFSTLEKAETKIKLWIKLRGEFLNLELTTAEAWATSKDKFFHVYAVNGSKPDRKELIVTYIINEMEVE